MSRRGECRLHTVSFRVEKCECVRLLRQPQKRFRSARSGCAGIHCDPFREGGWKRKTPLKGVPWRRWKKLLHRAWIVWHDPPVSVPLTGFERTLSGLQRCLSQLCSQGRCGCLTTTASAFFGEMRSYPASTRSMFATPQTPCRTVVSFGCRDFTNNPNFFEAPRKLMRLSGQS